MIELNEREQAAEGFELSVLASLPNERMDFITVETLADDFGLATCHRVAASIKRLIESGHPISLEATKTGQIVWLREKWDVGQDLALGHMRSLG